MNRKRLLEIRLYSFQPHNCTVDDRSLAPQIPHSQNLDILLIYYISLS